MIVSNIDDYNDDSSNMEGHYIRVDKILVDNKPASLTNSFTYKRSGSFYGKPYYRLAALLYKEKTDENAIIGFSWNGENVIGDKSTVDFLCYSA